MTRMSLMMTMTSERCRLKFECAEPWEQPWMIADTVPR